MRKRGRPRVLNQKTAKKLLEANGWTLGRAGRHQVKMVRPGRRPIPLPHNKGRDYPVGLSEAILKQAGLHDGEER